MAPLASTSWAKHVLAAALVVSAASGINPCLDPASGQYVCGAGATTINLDSRCGELADDDLPHVRVCFENAGRTGIEHITISSCSLLTSLPEDLFDGLTGAKKIRIRGCDMLDTLPAGLFSDTEELTLLNLKNNGFTSLPVDLFEGLTRLKTLPLQKNQGLTTLPAGIFDPLTQLADIYFQGNKNQQCIPPSTATTVRGDHNISGGTCGCEPVEAVSCPEGTTCYPGVDGYTCGGSKAMDEGASEFFLEEATSTGDQGDGYDAQAAALQEFVGQDTEDEYV